MNKEQRRKYMRNWMKDWRKRNPGKPAKLSKEWRERNPEKWKVCRKKYQEKLKKQGIGVCDTSLYGRPKKELLKLWNYQCAICGSTKKLEVHHIDGKGSNILTNKRNNKLENLVILCQKCHYKIHTPKRIKTLKERGLWSNKRIPKCLMCGTTERRHWGKGLCQRCYERTRQEYKAKWWQEKQRKKLLTDRG